MNEKEKKAIEIIKQEIDRLETPKDVYITDIKMLLIIVKRQEKEIEELKANLEKLEISFALSVNDRDSKAEMLKNSIAKTKIREKIKELKDFAKTIEEEKDEAYFQILQKIRVLKELLEENNDE